MDGSFLMAVLNFGWHIYTSLTSSWTLFPVFEPSTFTAAVYEHNPFIPSDPHQIYSRAEALEMLKKNLDVYSQQTKIAKQQGAQIIVFPEDGLYGTGFLRESILSFLEKIPDPKETPKWSPCSDPTRYPDTEVQHGLSCMAKETGLYVVANMGDWVPCNTRMDPKCPRDGRYQYNTDVAFDPEGTLVAKYHKTHLFIEPQFNTPNPEVVYFDTPFGRFGMIVCFDSLFKEPAVTMVTEHNITNIAFPTAWIDGLPTLSAIGYHSSFARGLGINLLSANMHRPSDGSVGSGIFTPKGMASYYYDSNPLSPGKLLVSTIDRLKHKSKTGDDSKNFNNALNNIMSIHSTDTTLPHQVVSSAPKSPRDFKSKGETFPSYLNYDLFTFQALEESSGNLNVCQNNVCCSLTYSFLDESHSSSDLFAFGVFDGLHTVEGQFYVQICALVKCADNTNRSSCGTGTKVSSTRFKSISMTGHFQTKFVYPQIVMAKNGQLILGDRKSWSFHDTTMTSGSGLDQPLISATLLGRYYSRDDGKGV